MIERLLYHEQINVCYFKDIPKEIPIILIKCRGCGANKIKTEFYWKKDGTINCYLCKKCFLVESTAYNKSEQGKKSNEKAQNKYNSSEHGQKKRKEWRASEAGRAAILRYYESEHGQKQIKEYQETEQCKEKSKEWQQSEAGKNSQKKYNKSPKGIINNAKGHTIRRDRENVTIKDLTPSQWLQILKDQDHKCNGCKESFSEEKPSTVDHIVPVTKGGDLTKDNVQALCKSCNSIKGNRPMAYLTKSIKNIVQKEKT